MSLLLSLPSTEEEVEVGLYGQNVSYQSNPVQFFQEPEIEFVWKQKLQYLNKQWYVTGKDVCYYSKFKSQLTKNNSWKL